MDWRPLVVLALATGCGRAETVSEAGVDASVDVDANVAYESPLQFCTDEQTWVCARDLAAGRIDMAQYTVCASGVTDRCASFTLPDGCRLRADRAQTCIDTLSMTTHLATPFDGIVECHLDVLCAP